MQQKRRSACFEPDRKHDALEAGGRLANNRERDQQRPPASRAPNDRYEISRKLDKSVIGDSCYCTAVEVDRQLVLYCWHVQNTRRVPNS